MLWYSTTMCHGMHDTILYIDGKFRARRRFLNHVTKMTAATSEVVVAKGDTRKYTTNHYYSYYYKHMSTYSWWWVPFLNKAWLCIATSMTLIESIYLITIYFFNLFALKVEDGYSSWHLLSRRRRCEISLAFASFKPRQGKTRSSSTFPLDGWQGGAL